MENPDTRAGAWSWVRSNASALFERVPAMFSFYFAALGEPSCSKPSAPTSMRCSGSG